MKHVIFIVTMLVAGVAGGVWFMHDREETRPVVADAAERVVVPDAAPIERAAPAVDARVVDASADGCDEVSCVLDDYARPCCDRFRSTTKPDAAVDGRPELDRAMIVAGVSTVKPRIQACGVPSIHGKVKVRVRVAPSGAVSSVTVLATPDPTLGACVHDAMSSVLFEPTQRGGMFSYPFVF